MRSDTRPGFPRTAPGSVIGIAHRGFSPEGLENTRAAFQAAIDLGFHHLETDVRATRDGVAILMHDARWDRVSGVPGKVALTHSRDLGDFPVGGTEPVLDLEAALDLFPGAVLNLDIKSDDAVVPVVRAIERSGAHGRVCVASFSSRRRRAVLARLSRPVASSASLAGVALAKSVSLVPGAPGMGRALGRAAALQIPESFRRMPVLGRSLIDAAHREGREVHVWTVNDEAGMERLIGWGVDGIVTDRADLLRGVLDRLKTNVNRNGE